jgi:hypothetical protein
MMNANRLTLSIADLVVQLDISECTPLVKTRVWDHYQAFVVSHPDPLYMVQMHIERGEPFIPFIGGGTWQIRSKEHQGRIEFESHLEKGWMNPATGQAELTLREDGDPENFLRVMYAWLCLGHEGLLVHSSGVVRDGKGYAFFGASGSGKTTVSRLSSNHTILSDDIVIVRKKDGKFRLYGVPFRGELIEAPRTNASADLSGLFTLVKDNVHRLEPMPVEQGVARLVACIPFIMAQPRNIMRVMDIANELVSQVPVRSLHFKRDSGFWRVIDGL